MGRLTFFRINWKHIQKLKKKSSSCIAKKYTPQQRKRSVDKISARSPSSSMHTTYNEYIKAYIKGQMNYKGVGSLSFPLCYVPSLRVWMWACSVLDHTAIALQNTIICNSSPYLYFVLPSFYEVGKK